MEYNFRETEKKWQKYWAENKTFKTPENTSKPKYYVLDMFPYPSGAGLHVGHPLGYIASDIFARYKRLKGFNVLHPMGYDSFGLPAEQYAIQTGQHPEITTKTNIARYREQLDQIGFSYDWDREVRTSDPEYYKWTQWVFIKLFNSWYNTETDKAEDISTLIPRLEKQNFELNGATKDWKSLSEKERSDVLLTYRLAYLSDTMVNWCPQLGTVLANEEVVDGVSERGGYPVERKLMKQWSLRITAYADRLLKDLETIDWTDSIREAQRNWIGKSEGTSIRFRLEDSSENIEVFTTRPDTIFGVSFVTLAPEHTLVSAITTSGQKSAVEEYVTFAKNRSERERMADVKKITGVFTGAYCIHPFTGNRIPVWIGDYVLAGYGTGAVMAVPAHDTRDFAFATHFKIPKTVVIQPAAEWNPEESAYDEKNGTMINSDFLNGLQVKEAIRKAIQSIEEKGLGLGRTNYRLRDAIFGRQRYWGEPIPVYYEDGIPKVIPIEELPLVLPEVDKYLPTETGEPPLARAQNWKYKGKYEFEYSTMPGWAGSSWYFLRYMDAHNSKEFASREKINYWQNVDLYIGGSEHATGHLLYIRFWTKFLYDLGYIPVQEPAKKLINQGMILGTSAFVYRINGTNKLVSLNLKDRYETTALHVDVNLVNNNELDIERFRAWRDEFRDSEMILENGKYICGSEVEKMSKRWNNVVNPDDICEKYGADCLRLYEMFLGPLELPKPWNTNGITGVSNFMRKLWRLYHNGEQVAISEEPATKAELKVLHKTIKKIVSDVEGFSFNTSVSNFMICVNELTELKCNKREILAPLAVIISPYAPHIAEELWSRLGNRESITYAAFPDLKEEYLVETAFNYPVSFNGKTKFYQELELSLSQDDVIREVMAHEQTQKYLEGKTPKKVIVVHNRIVNIVV
jgi:leucyl-tRNA synthetase